MRAITIAICIVMLAGAAAGEDERAPAVDSAPPATVPPPTQYRPLTNGMGSIPQAPVGHRQPTLRDLPPSVRRDENSESDAQRPVNPLGGVPSICSGC
jgi:hypothetical protein